MKLRIKISNGKLRRISIFGIPIFEYGIQNNQKCLKVLLFNKLTQKEHVEIFYL